MQHRAIRQVVIATLCVSSSTVLVLSILGRLATQKPKQVITPDLVFGAGMGPNLMTPKPINSSDNSSTSSFDELIESIREDLGTIRLYMSSHGQSYIDYGDGNLVPWKGDNSNSIQTDDTVDPFGDALSNTSPSD